MTVIVLLVKTVCKLSEPQLSPSFLFCGEAVGGLKKTFRYVIKNI